MAIATHKQGRSKVVPRSAVEQLNTVLTELPKKEKQELPLGEAIAESAEMLHSALAKGYGYKELAELLSAQLGVSVSVWSLKRYLSAANKTQLLSSAAPKAKRGRKAKTAAPDAETAAIELPVVAVAAPDEPVEAEVFVPEPTAEVPTEVKKRGARGSARSKAAAEAAPATKRGTRTRTAAATQPEAEAKTTTRRTRTAATATRGRRKAI